MATTNDLKNGMVLNIDGQLWSVTEFQHVKPGKGPAFVRTKLKNVESGKTVDKTFNAGTKVETANVDKRTMQYLYNDGTSYVFMDVQSYDQVEVPPSVVGDAKNFMLENQEAIVASNEGRVLYVELPASVELEVTYTEPGLQGDRSTGGTKPDRRDRDGPAVHHHRRADQGGHARLVVPGSHQLLMSARTKARKRALDVLFAADVRGDSAVQALDTAIEEGDGPTNEYTSTLVRGVVAEQARIDGLLSEHAQGWTLERMPAVDRNVLRLGVYELLFVDDVPPAVAVSEAVALVRDLSTDESPAFVNGVLGAVLRQAAAG
jgi:elongation factor P